jgi:uncharacterized membrane-anchored protein
MQFSVNHPVLYILTGLIVAVVLGQSVYFLLKALKRSRAIGMDQKKIRKTIQTAAVFTIAPAVSIVISVIALSKTLGIPLPWLRLSVVGSLSYETIAATNAESAMGLTFGQVTNMTATEYVTVAAVMTVSIMMGIWLVPLIGKKIENGVISLENRDQKWGEIFSSSMFIGMISAFVGYVFCDFSSVFRGETWGLIPVCVMAVSAVLMCISGLLSKKQGFRWLSDYALPISLVGAMLSAIPITAWLA